MSGLSAYLSNAAGRVPDAPAVMALDAPDVSYQELDRRAGALARAFTDEFGLARGDRVAIAMGNDPAYVEILFGAWRAGLCVAPMNPRLHPREFASLAADCEARLCFSTPDIYPGLRDQMPADVTLIDCASQRYHALLAAEPMDELADIDADAPAWLFYTSGTTGRPKGATLTHRNLDAMAQSFITDSGAAVGEALLHLAPLSHAGGLIGLSYVAQGLPQIVPPSGALTAPVLERALRSAGRVSFFAVPTLVRRLMDPALLDPSLHEHIVKIMFGGAPMYAEDLREAISCFGADRLWGGYGQGEAPCTITHLPSPMLGDAERADYQEMLASVGVSRTGVEVRIVCEDGGQAPVDHVGEVVVKGDVVMTGYWNMPDATAAALRDGWLHTGDLGRIGETGLLTLVDRSKDMIISGGSNIYPREIEEVLLTHPSVRAVAVVGEKNREWGEVAVAFVVVGRKVEPQELDEICLRNMARYKRPKRYVFVDELPTSSYGKVLKTELRSTLSSHSNPTK